MTHDAEPIEDDLPELESWDLPDRLTWDQCLIETAFPQRRAEAWPDPEDEN
jgi:hypothetical protein